MTWDPWLVDFCAVQSVAIRYFIVIEATGLFYFDRGLYFSRSCLLCKGSRRKGRVGLEEVGVAASSSRHGWCWIYIGIDRKKKICTVGLAAG